jgi:hypothetical protein
MDEMSNKAKQTRNKFIKNGAGDSWHSSKIIRADEKNAGII